MTRTRACCTPRGWPTARAVARGPKGREGVEQAGEVAPDAGAGRGQRSSVDSHVEQRTRGNNTVGARPRAHLERRAPLVRLPEGAPAAARAGGGGGQRLDGRDGGASAARLSTGNASAAAREFRLRPRQQRTAAARAGGGRGV